MTPNDPLFPNQWFYSLIGDIEAVWDDFDGSGVHVGIYDTGVDFNHPDLAGNYDATLHVTVGGIDLWRRSGRCQLGQAEPRNRGRRPDRRGRQQPSRRDRRRLRSLDHRRQHLRIRPARSTSTRMISARSSTPSRRWRISTSPTTAGARRLPSWMIRASNSSGSFDQETVAAYGSAAADGRGGLGTVVLQAAGNDDLDANGSGLNGSRFTVTVAAALQRRFCLVLLELRRFDPVDRAGKRRPGKYRHYRSRGRRRLQFGRLHDHVQRHIGGDADRHRRRRPDARRQPGPRLARRSELSLPPHPPTPAAPMAQGRAPMRISAGSSTAPETGTAAASISARTTATACSTRTTPCVWPRLGSTSIRSARPRPTSSR